MDAKPISAIRRMSVAQLRDELARDGEGNSPLILIDVREPYEFDSGHIEQAVNIPLGELPSHLHEIPPQANAIFICHMGGRSFAACQMALQAGVSAPANVEGGMAAWEETIGE